MPDEQYQWVRSSKGGGKGYWRRLARTVSDPTPLQAAQRLRMSILSNKLPGAQGTTQLRDSRRIPLNAALISPLLKGIPEIQEDTRSPEQQGKKEMRRVQAAPPILPITV